MSEVAATDVTFVVASADRFDLLQITLETFLEHNTAPIARYLLTEDRGGQRVFDVVKPLPVHFDVLVHDPPIGAYNSIDRAYETVTTPYIFHCEDDWRFFRSGFIEESKLLLDAFPEISMVLCRRPGQTAMSDRILQGDLREHRGVRFRLAPRLAHPHWLGYSFNPGLRRLDDYRKIGSFHRRGMEIDASIFFKRRGMTMAVLEEPACETIGQKRHLVDPNSRRNWRGYLPEKQRTIAHHVERALDRWGIRKAQ